MAFSVGPSLLALWVWVQDNIRPRHGPISKVCQSVLHCSTKLTPPTCPPNRTPTPATAMGGSACAPVQDDEELTYSSMASSSAVTPSSGTCLVPSTSTGSTHRGDKGGPSHASCSSSPHGTCQPTSYSWTFGGGGSSSSSSHIS